jgi:hypothetical protein
MNVLFIETSIDDIWILQAMTQKINSGDNLPREQEYICEICMKDLIILIIFTGTGLLNIMLP